VPGESSVRRGQDFADAQRADRATRATVRLESDSAGQRPGSRWWRSRSGAGWRAASPKPASASC